jgi:hypothetical protein
MQDSSCEWKRNCKTECKDVPRKESRLSQEPHEKVSSLEDVLRTSNGEAHGDVAYVSWGEKCL